MIYNITPVPAPRMTKADAWRKRPCVLRYFNFKDDVKKAYVKIPHSGAHIIFHIPMPQSWGRAKKEKHNDRPHKSRPDVDNLYKALSDAIYNNDSCIWDVRISKVWSYTGKIEIRG